MLNGIIISDEGEVSQFGQDLRNPAAMLKAIEEVAKELRRVEKEKLEARLKELTSNE